VDGDQQTPIGGNIHAALLWRAHGVDTSIGSVDAPITAASGMTMIMGVTITATTDGDVTAPSVPAVCGDLLVLQLTPTSGTSAQLPFPMLDLP
jgi:hypothetical protein